MSNPFLDGSLKALADDARDQAKEEYLIRLAHGKKLLEDTGVKMGDTITVSWEVDRRYGDHDRSQTGIVSRLDDWIHLEPTNRSPGHLYMPVSALKHVRIEQADATQVYEPEPQQEINPFMTVVSPPTATNPFMS